MYVCIDMHFHIHLERRNAWLHSLDSETKVHRFPDISFFNIYIDLREKGRGRRGRRERNMDVRDRDPSVAFYMRPKD